MKTIGLIKLSRLHLASHVDFHQSVAAAATEAGFANAAWTALLGAYTTQLETLAEVVRRQRASVWTADVQAADHMRDSTMGQLFLTIGAAAKSTLPDEHTAGVKLQTIVHPYHNDTRDQLTDQTERVRELVAELREGEAAEWVARLGLDAVVARLDAQNTEFGRLYAKRAEERRTQPGAGVDAREQRRVVDGLYRQIAGVANSVSVAGSVGSATEFDPVRLGGFIDRVNALVGQYRLVVANQAKHRTIDIDKAIRRAAGRMAMHRDAYAAAEALHNRLVAQKAEGVVSVVERLIEEETPRPDATRQ